MEDKVFYGTMTSIPEADQEQNIPEQNVQKLIGEKEIGEALATLQEYQRAKAMLDNRMLEDELWWELRHWEALKKQPRAMSEEEARDYFKKKGPEPSSAWLFNAITNKHADAMDNYPEPVVLPRELSDKESAKTLSEVLPVIMEYNEFEQTYSDSWWEKLKHGTAAYGVFWNSNKDNGLGDIDIKAIDLLKVYWEPGITDIQDSRNLFICDLVDTDLLEEQYPQYKGKLSGNNISLPQYQYDAQIDLSKKTVVVDWYYKVKNGTSTVLHYAKFVNNCLLYASENDPEYRERGFYDHGMYPIVFDVMFPEKNTPVGFGYVAICKDPQLYIDKVSSYVLENAMITAKKRYFVSEQTNVNEDEFLDWNEPIVHVSGMIDDTRIREITGQPVSPTVLNVVNQKIEEMKDTASNRDINSGGAGSGVTAAAAIAALQEAGNKSSRDMISSAYRAYRKIIKITVELIRQFYDEERTFRITLPNGTFDFVGLSNEQIGEQPIMDSNGMPMVNGMGEVLNRKPIFDLKIKAQKKNPFSKMEQNETAKELYRLGFFNPDQAQSAMLALDMMSFEGIEDVREKIQQGQTLQNMLQQVMAENMQLQAMLGMNPDMMGMPGASGPMGAAPGSPDTISGAVSEAGTPMTPYGQALAKRSAPSAEDTGKVMR